jgi:hypothetical protein
MTCAPDRRLLAIVIGCCLVEDVVRPYSSERLANSPASWAINKVFTIGKVFGQPSKMESCSVGPRSVRRSLEFDTSELDDFRPLFNFGTDELLAFGGRQRHRSESEIRKPCFESWIIENAVYFLVEYFGDLCFKQNRDTERVSDDGGRKCFDSSKLAKCNLVAPSPRTESQGRTLGRGLCRARTIREQ